MSGDGFTGRCYVAFMPCGCWSAVQLSMSDLAEEGKRVARFMKEAAQDKAERVDNMAITEWQSLRNGVGGDLTHGCDHDPKWGGVVSDYDDCPRCMKTLKRRKDGNMPTHKDGWSTCPQGPYPSRRVAS